MRTRTLKRKLVRSKTLQQLTKQGYRYKSVKVFDKKRLIELTKRKILEEAQELCDARKNNEVIEEMADLLEVIKSYARILGISMRKVGKKENRKRKTHGSIKNDFLYSVEDKPRKLKGAHTNVT